VLVIRVTGLRCSGEPGSGVYTHAYELGTGPQGFLQLAAEADPAARAFDPVSRR
jgi:hypothetical protein